MNNTGMALGRVRAVLYYENSRGHLMLAPSTESAHWLWKEKRNQFGQTLYDQGYEMKEAGSWPEIQRLQDRLIEQENRENAAVLEKHQAEREHARKRVASNLYARLISSATSDYEKEFIRNWLLLRDETKRDKYRQALEQRNTYLWIAEMDSGHDSNITDRIKV